MKILLPGIGAHAIKPSMVGGRGRGGVEGRLVSVRSRPARSPLRVWASQSCIVRPWLKIKTIKIPWGYTKATIETTYPSPGGPEDIRRGSKPHPLVPGNMISRWRRCKEIKRIIMARWNSEICKVDSEMTVEEGDSNDRLENHKDLCSEACSLGKSIHMN